MRFLLITPNLRWSVSPQCRRPHCVGSGTLPASMPASNSVDPGYAFLVSAVDSAFSENDLCTLIAAAAEDRWLVDSATGSVRVMDDEGHEANR
eukprot:scaffold2619_cov59-Phaeocystis_antarctica.AAC.1